MKIFSIVSLNIVFVVSAILFALFLIRLIFTIIINFVKAIALYCVAEKMDEKLAVFALFPFLRDYLEYTIPKDELNLLGIKIKNRKVAAIIIVSVYYIILDRIQIPIRPIHYLMRLFFKIIRIKRYYDMYCLIEKKNAVILAIFSELSKLVHAIVLIRYACILKKRGIVNE